MYTRQRDAFLRDTIGGVSQSSQRYRKQKLKTKGMIDRKLFEHGKKYVRMMLAINDRAEDYPKDEEASKPPIHLSAIAGRAEASSSSALCFTPLKSRGQAQITPPTPLDLEIREIELIDLVDDSDESDSDLEAETDDEEIILLSRNPAAQGFQKRGTDIIDLVSSSDRDDESDVGISSIRKKGKRRAISTCISEDGDTMSVSDNSSEEY